MPPTRRRYPNFVAFISTGAILGFVVGSAFAYFGDDDTTEYGRSFTAVSSVLFLGVRRRVRSSASSPRSWPCCWNAATDAVPPVGD